ncbi:hypothetical protein GM708_07605 [Vibrio cholerae]|nr:hypothetical protein [Vibrio cholerae]
MSENNRALRLVLQRLLHRSKMDRIEWKRAGKNRYMFSSTQVSAVVSQTARTRNTELSLLNSDGKEIGFLNGDSDLGSISESEAIKEELQQLYEVASGNTVENEMLIQKFLDDLGGF